MTSQGPHRRTGRIAAPLIAILAAASLVAVANGAPQSQNSGASSTAGSPAPAELTKAYPLAGTPTQQVSTSPNGGSATPRQPSASPNGGSATPRQPSASPRGLSAAPPQQSASPGRVGTGPSPIGASRVGKPHAARSATRARAATTNNHWIFWLVLGVGLVAIFAMFWLEIGGLLTLRRLREACGQALAAARERRSRPTRERRRPADRWAPASRPTPRGAGASAPKRRGDEGERQRSDPDTPPLSAGEGAGEPESARAKIVDPRKRARYVPSFGRPYPGGGSAAGLGLDGEGADHDSDHDADQVLPTRETS